MNISFTGIYNININSKKENSPVSFNLPSGLCMEVDKKNHELNLECDLFDDEKGGDLGDFYRAMSKNNVKCYDFNNLNHIKIKAHRKVEPVKGKTSEGHPAIAFNEKLDISINDHPLEVSDEESDRPNLHLLTFIAHLTSKLSKRADLTKEQKTNVQEINKITEDLALHFIDEVMVKK